MRCVMAMFLAVGLTLGVYGGTTAQRQAAQNGATDGASGAPVNPPPVSQIDNFLLYLGAYLVGTSGKEGLKFLKAKYAPGLPKDDES